MNKKTLRHQILNISVNLARVSEFAMQPQNLREVLISKFLDQTEDYLDEIKKADISADLQDTLNVFEKDFKILKKQQINDKNYYQWAEKALTWANILEHRSSLV
ncbi:hypothetical protein HY389_01480 [Candidatus Daviesbacteria bacterium]|nr:hypothetical protein [Candidatus Daviesbacteria bacterium]